MAWPYVHIVQGYFSLEQTNYICTMQPLTFCLLLASLAPKIKIIWFLCACFVGFCLFGCWLVGLVLCLFVYFQIENKYNDAVFTADHQTGIFITTDEAIFCMPFCVECLRI